MAKLQFTLKEYIANPLGDATMTYREVYRNLYTDKLDKILEKRNLERVRYHLYYTDKDTYYIHFKIPSESVEELYYDTVLYFYPDKKNPNLKSISDHFVKFYSNDDMFNFVYTYNFNKQGLLIPELKSKLSQYALKTPAKKTNPKGNVGYVKTIYLAYLLMERYGLFHKMTFNTYGTSYVKTNLLNQVLSYDEKTQEYQLKKESQLAKRRKDSEAASDKIQQARQIRPNARDNTTLITKVPQVETVKRDTRTVNKIMKSNKKNANKIKKL